MEDLKIRTISTKEWWEDGGGFFGNLYMEGDDSIDGFIPGKKQTIEERTFREVDGLIKLLGLYHSKKARIIDVPCGYGRHTNMLSSMGYNATGIDINSEHLSKARRDKKVNNLNAKFIKKDIRDLGKDLYSQFDILLNMFYSFGFFKSEEDNNQTMQEFYNVLCEGGKMLLHTDVTIDMIENGHYLFHEIRDLTEDTKLKISERYDPSLKRITGTWDILGNHSSKRLREYNQRIYSIEEYRNLAMETGFSEIYFYGSFDGDQYKSSSTELIMIAKK